MKTRSGFVAVTTTVDKTAVARKLADRIVRSRVAACVQWFPIQSVYWWKGNVEQSSECLLVCKTRAVLAKKLVSFIRKHHSYEVPEIVVIPLAGGWPAYLKWIEAETRVK